MHKQCDYMYMYRVKRNLQERTKASFVPRPKRGRWKRAWFPLFVHAGEGTNDIYMYAVTWSGLWHLLCLLPHPPSVRSCKMTAKRPQPHYHQQHTSLTYYQNKQKQRYVLPRKRPHADFYTIVDRCSGLHVSITSGLPSCWRAFERARYIHYYDICTSEWTT